MDQGTHDIFSIILIFATILYLFVLLIIANVRYSTFIQLMRKTKSDFEEDLGGLFVGDGGKYIPGFGEYWFRAPLPINAETKDPKILYAIKKHDEVIKLFWISAIFILPLVIIILNLTEK